MSMFSQALAGTILGVLPGLAAAGELEDLKQQLNLTLTRLNKVEQWQARKSYFDSGDTAWVMASSAFVLSMTLPGLALFYGGEYFC